LQIWQNGKNNERKGQGCNILKKIEKKNMLEYQYFILFSKYSQN